MDLGLRNVRVLVTAASQGLGKAAARRFSLEGAVVVINSRRLDELQATAAEINAESGNPVFTIAGDVSDPAQAAKIVKNAAEMLGGLDVLVTNAGGPPSGGFEDFDVEQWEQSTRLVVFSVVSLIKAAIPYLKESDRAAILAVQSVSVKQPVYNLTLSNAIRPAVIGLIKSLSQELGPSGIRVNAILPGNTETDRIVDLMKARGVKNNTSEAIEREKAYADIPLRRFGQTDEFANAAVFLCSPAAGYINGVMLPVDGGVIKATL
ncbi:MAG: SDR family oxidoreductase [Anaerolinea sp.]|nr:SDR family oxidoreductase [Anaerolinea sp.]